MYNSCVSIAIGVSNEEEKCFYCLKRMTDIDKVYHNPKTGYVGAKQLFEKLKGKYSMDEIKEYLKKDNTAQSFVKLSHKPLLEPIQVYAPFELWELDLIDYSKEEDRGYVMVVVDDFTKYVWAEVMGSKDTANFTEALHKILRESPQLPKKIMSDGESAMGSADCQKMLKVNDIEWIDRRKLHSPTVERMIKTIKGKLERIFVDRGERKWSKVIKDVVRNINETVASSTGVKPIDAVKEKETVAYNLHRRNAGILRKINELGGLKVGDEVKVATKSFLMKGTKPTWSTQTYKVIGKSGNRLKLEDYGETVSVGEVVKV